MTTLLLRSVDQLADRTQSGNLVSSSQKIDSLIILDRKVDMITPMLTQLTYAGLIDELMGIKNCMYSQLTLLWRGVDRTLAYIEIPASLLTPPGAQNAQPSSSSTTGAAPSTSGAVLPRDTKESKKKYHLNPATDAIFSELQDLNFSNVGKTLNKTARRLDEDYKVSLYQSSVDLVAWLSARVDYRQRPWRN